ncbi:MAG: OsmC family protein [Planctomycetota bacterium]|jgi:uncharacterized OsmC-like protein
MSTSTQAKINGIDTDALKQTMEAVKADPAQGVVQFQVATEWAGGTCTETSVNGWRLAGQDLPRTHTIAIDEPPELLGTDTAANPQEHLFAAMNACMAATYVAACSMQGIELEHLSIETTGELDLRGFLGLDGSVEPGYKELQYRVRIKGDGTPRQFDAVHEWVKKTSPNYFNMANAIRLNAELIVE